MKLSMPDTFYNRRAEVERNRQLERADGQNHKRGQDVEIGAARVILTADNGTRWALKASNTGTLTLVAV
jgi:hypothetical protein